MFGKVRFAVKNKNGNCFLLWYGSVNALKNVALAQMPRFSKVHIAEMVALETVWLFRRELKQK